MEEKILKLLEHMSKDVEHMSKDIEHMSKDVEHMSKDIEDLKSDMSEVKQKVNAVYDQTVILTEFKTEVIQKLDKIENGIEVWYKEDFKNKVELVEIRKKMVR